MKILIDTNILVYFFDQNEPVRQQVAISVLKAVNHSRQGWLSAQCLAEFSNIALNRLKPALLPEAVIAHIRDFATEYAIIPLTDPVIQEALRGVRDYQFAYYDAQIWAAARLHQIPVLFSEDFNPGVYGGVRVVNPFAPAFVLEDWL